MNRESFVVVVLFVGRRHPHDKTARKVILRYMVMTSKHVKLCTVCSVLIVTVSICTYLLASRIKDEINRLLYESVLTLSFETCEGLTNQRIAILQGLLLGYLMNRQVILPKLYSSYNTSEADILPFSAIYDVNHLRLGLRGVINVTEDFHYSPRGNIYKAKNIYKTPSFWASRKLAAVSNLDLGCTFNALKVDREELVSLLWTIDSMLIYNANITKDADAIIRSLNSSGQGYTALHFRVEDDWVEHCKKWKNMGDGSILDNCMTNTKMIDNVFKLERIPTDRPLYIAGAYMKEFLWNYHALEKLMQRYKVVTKEDVLHHRAFLSDIQSQREMHAAIDFAVCLQSELFVGNSVSTFSALIELRRMQGHSPSIHYNGGDIPLAKLIPPPRSAQVLINAIASPLKWVFSLALTTRDHDDLIDMAKVAVASAINNTGLDPVCLLYVPHHSKGEKWVVNIIDWFEAAGVTVLHHVPKFSSLLETVARKNHSNQYSPLFTDHYKMIGAFLRFDIPKLGFVDDYILYTDADVYFTNDLTLIDFKHLPEHILMAWESFGNERYGNAGVALLNVNGMRRTYSSLLKWTFSPTAIRNGLLFESGPLDQGAYNGFYRDLIITSPYVINHRPYWGLPPESPQNKTSIIHFHGPKPRDYLNHRKNASLDLPIFLRLFEMCDEKGDQCYGWVDKWVQLNRSLHGRKLRTASGSLRKRLQPEL